MALRSVDPAVLAGFRVQIFDYYQSLKPREYKPSQVKIIDIDDASLERFPVAVATTVLAELVERLADAGASAFDVRRARGFATQISRDPCR